MLSLTRSLLALLTPLGAWFALLGPAPADAPEAPAAESTITLHDADARWVHDIEDDLGRFEAAGLAPIAVDVHVWDHTRTAACSGFTGYFDPSDGRLRIDLCLDYLDSDLGTHLRHKLVLHELAHAWIHAHTATAEREAFMELRGATTWNAPDAPHFARGTEVAANTVMAMLHADDPSDDRYLCGYRVLTGHPGADDRPDPCG